MIDIFARAAHAPQSSVRVPAGAVEALDAAAEGVGDRGAARRAWSPTSVLADFGIPRSVLTYVNYPTHFDSRPDAGGARGHRHPGAAARGLRGQALGLLGAPPRPRPVPRPDADRARSAAGAGWSAALAQVIEQQIPDELLRLGRRLQGTVSLEKAVRGRVVMVTGASSGIGHSAALKIADAGGIVLLVARTPEKLEETRDADRGRRRDGATSTACDLSDMDDIDRMADEVLAQHGHVDVLVNNAGRSIRRSIALSYDRFHDFERTMQLNYFGAVRLILKLLPVMRERTLGPDRQRQLDRRADQHAAVLGLRRLEGGARRVLALHRLGDHRRRRPHHRRSTCRWCGRR